MAENSTFTRVKGADDNDYICPLEIVKKNTPLSEDLLEDCVEAEVVGRYIGYHNITNA